MYIMKWRQCAEIKLNTTIKDAITIWMHNLSFSNRSNILLLISNNVRHTTGMLPRRLAAMQAHQLLPESSQQVWGAENSKSTTTPAPMTTLLITRQAIAHSPRNRLLSKALMAGLAVWTAKTSVTGSNFSDPKATTYRQPTWFVTTFNKLPFSHGKTSVSPIPKYKTDDWQRHSHLHWQLCLQQSNHNTMFDFIFFIKPLKLLVYRRRRRETLVVQDR